MQNEHIHEIAYPQLEQLIWEWKADGMNGTPYNVLDHLFKIFKANGEGIVPVEYRYDENHEPVGYTIKTMTTEKGECFIPFFTRLAYGEKFGIRTHVIVLPLMRLAKIASESTECKGLLLDPRTYDFVIPKDVCIYFAGQQ